MTKTDRKTSLKPVNVLIIPEFLKRACSDKPIFQVEIDGDLQPESFNNGSAYTDYKKHETEDLEK